MRTSIRLLLAGVFATAFSFPVFAQAQSHERSVRVIGTAEMEIVPDEIYVSIALSEFIKDKKKTGIETLEKGLMNFLTKSLSVQPADIKMNDMDAALIKNRKSKEEIITVTYDVKLGSMTHLYKIYAVMDSLSIADAHVRKFSHSKMDEYKKQVKINAMKAAKEKASYLLEAIGSKAGKPLQVWEPTGLVSVDAFYIDETLIANNEFTHLIPGHRKAKRGGSWKALIGDEDTGELEKTIKLSYSIEAAFEILP